MTSRDAIQKHNPDHSEAPKPWGLQKCCQTENPFRAPGTVPYRRNRGFQSQTNQEKSHFPPWGLLSVRVPGCGKLPGSVSRTLPQLKPVISPRNRRVVKITAFRGLATYALVCVLETGNGNKTDRWYRLHTDNRDGLSRHG